MADRAVDGAAGTRYRYGRPGDCRCCQHCQMNLTDSSAMREVQLGNIGYAEAYSVRDITINYLCGLHAKPSPVPERAKPFANTEFSAAFDRGNAKLEKRGVIRRARNEPRVI